MEQLTISQSWNIVLDHFTRKCPCDNLIQAQNLMKAIAVLNVHFDGQEKQGTDIKSMSSEEFTESINH